MAKECSGLSQKLFRLKCLGEYGAVSRGNKAACELEEIKRIKKSFWEVLRK